MEVLKTRFVLICAFVFLLGGAPAALGHWDDTMPFKWVQYPDLETTGIDVSASFNYKLADDFQCVVTGPLTDFHIWCSWYHDYYGQDPNQVDFLVEIYDDVPATPTSYSMPGKSLWSRYYTAGDFDVRVWATGIAEGWMELPDYYEFPADYTCWQYNFYVDPQDPEVFIQRGTADEPVTYWLSIQAFPRDTLAALGWKTSLDHWNDDAVGDTGSAVGWEEMRYPPGHVLQGESIDLAFVITGQELDFGDAPDPCYPTLLVNDGARHVITAAGPWLDDGSGTDSPDPEPDGQPTVGATGDDADGNDDEDGITIAPSPLVPGGVATISFTVGGGPGCIDGWIDWNQNGSWEAAEAIPSVCYAAAGPYVIATPVPPAAVPGTTYARFRMSSVGGLSPTGLAADGEVEDLRVEIRELALKAPTPHLKWSQPPIEIDPNIQPPIYCGWDEPSWTVDPCEIFGFDTAADDFRCLGTMPITSLHWWGSHVGWEDIDPPTFAPISGWLIRFFTNVPANATADPDYSHPDKLLWEVQVSADRVRWEWVGYDEFPNGSFDSCFQYNLDLERQEWFWQGDFVDHTTDDVFWISIEAIYATGTDPIYPWGWKTRPWHWMDDAVSYQCRTMPDGVVVCRMWPIEDQIWGESYDLAFELDTDPNYIKWEQPYDSIHHWPHYWDEYSMANVYHFTETKWSQLPDLEPSVSIDVDATADLANMWPAQVIADDFECTSPNPITDVHLWTSWLNDRLPEDDPNNVIFTLSIHDDIPATETSPSMPGDVLWWREFRPGEFKSSIWAGQLDEGWYSPCSDYYEPGADTICWKYDFYIDPCEAFLQEGTPANPKVYWLDVQAVPQATDPWIRFGWKTSMYHWNDDGVWGIGSEPYGGPWKELLYPPGHPYGGESIDLAFEITSESEDFVINRMVADDWPCEANTPITAAVWWGSYIGYRYQPCTTPQPHPTRPDYFLLTIWTDVPAVPGTPDSYSHPGQRIWTYYAYDYDEVLVGYDKQPELQSGPPREPVFRYSVKLPREAWFFQDANDGIYWFSVVAVYDQNQPDFDWGWTNHEHVYNDDAVAGYIDPASGLWVWEELYDQTGESEDLSFILFTDPDPNLGTCWDAAECGGQPLGDSTCDGSVNFLDLGALKVSFFANKGDPNYNCCADFNHDEKVNFLDLGILKVNFFTVGHSPATGEQICPP